MTRIERSHAPLFDGTVKREPSLDRAGLQADIERGLADLVAGRVWDFEVTRIVERGRRLLAGRTPSA